MEKGESRKRAQLYRLLRRLVCAHTHGVASVGCISAFKIMKLLPSEGEERCLHDMGFGEEGGGAGRFAFVI